MEVLVAGAHGQIGQRLVRLLVQRGHGVRGLIRNSDQAAAIEALGAVVVVADLERDDVTPPVEGGEAIVFTAGAAPGSGAPRKQTMDYGGAVKLIDAAPSLGRRGEVSRDDVAATIAFCLEEASTIGRTFELLAGDTPIPDALRSL